MAEIEDTLKILNRLADEYLKDLNLSELEPFETTGKDTSFTILPPDVDAVTLQDLKAGMTLNIQSLSLTSNAAISRSIIGYSLAMKIVANPRLFNFYFTMLLNSNLTTLKKYVGSLVFRKVTVHRPGSDKIVFREIENSSGFELRVYVEKVKSD